MTTLASFLLERGAVSLADLEEAMRRQVLGGGDLGSHLLGTGSLDEPRLLGLLGEYHGLPLGPAGRLPPMPLELARVMPPSALRRYHVFPLGLTRRELHVATVMPLDPRVEKELGHALGHTLRQVLVTPLRLSEALWRYAAAPFNAALRAVVAQLDGAAAVSDEPVPRRPASHRSRQQATKPYRRMLEPSDGSRIVAADRGASSALLARLHGQPDPSAELGEPDEPDLAYDEAEISTDSFEAGSEFELGSEGPTTQRSGADGWGREAPAPSEPTGAPISRPVESAPEIILAVQADFAIDQVDDATPAVGGIDQDFALSPPPAAVLGPDDVTPAEPPVADESPTGTRVAADEAEAVEPPVADEAPAEPAAAVGHAEQPAPPGPLGREAAERLLGEAEDVHQTLEIFGRFAQQFFARVLLLAVQGGRAEVRVGHGVSAEAKALALTLAEPSLIKHAHDTAQIVVDRLGSEGLDGALRAALPAGDQIEVVAIPILVRQRVVAVLYADDAGDNVDRDAVAEVAGFANVVGNAIATLIVRRKREKT